jgi:ketosteroid isomerase-like protein
MAAGVHRDAVTAWVRAYERAWRSPGVAGLPDLFTPAAVYRQGPYHEPVDGLAAIGRMWEDQRDGPDETFSMTHEVVAVENATAVVRVAVGYGDPVDREYLDLWIIRFAADGRCEHFEEWPFWPDRSIVAERSDGG